MRNGKTYIDQFSQLRSCLKCTRYLCVIFFLKIFIYSNVFNSINFTSISIFYCVQYLLNKNAKISAILEYVILQAKSR